MTSDGLGRILIVDDEQSVREVRPDLVLLDVRTR